MNERLIDVQSIKQRFSIIGNANALNRAIFTAAMVAPTEISVLITGESGVGKEVFSHIIHQLSNRKHEKFIAINCGAIPEGTIDSELFGHEKGAFTGATDARKGYFETVNGGTIFLDEVGEMPLGTQARLLRVLETGEFIKVGSSKVQKTDVRVLAATNVQIETAIEKNRFREDLYYRLNTVNIKIPSLRERVEDIPLLFRKFCVDFAEKYRIQAVQLEPHAQDLLKKAYWPGNIRQLRNIAEQVTVLEQTRFLTADQLVQYLPTHPGKQLPVLVAANHTAPPNDLSDREILYKILFDMRNELNELKQIVNNIGKGVGSELFNDNSVMLSELSSNDDQKVFHPTTITNYGSINNPATIKGMRFDDATSQAEDIDESLSINDVEKELIEKALKKHHGKRKHAALELGISERTLYRKIKEYDISE